MLCKGCAAVLGTHWSWKESSWQPYAGCQQQQGAAVELLRALLLVVSALSSPQQLVQR